MAFEKIGRIPKRIGQDLQILGLAENWQEILSSKIKGQPLSVIKLRNGVVINAPEQVKVDFLFHEIWLDKSYSPTGYEINANDVVLDIGANIGVFALYAATRAPGVEVYSYEPFPENARYFERNLKESKLKNVHFFNKALSDQIGTQTLHIHDSWILHSLTEKIPGGEEITVDCTSLDEALKNIPECHLLKLDCEGGEYAALYPSSPETMGKVKKIVAEYHNLDKGDRNGDGLREFLEKNNFQIDIFQPLSARSGFICAKTRN
jgi:FkbM family methyltransferase